MSEPSIKAGKSIVFRRSALIFTGMVMFVFITMHLTNLILGLHSVALMDEWRGVLTGVWNQPGLKQLLLLSLVVHFCLALYSLYRRNTLRVPAYDMVQMIAGVAIIPLMAPHVFGIMAYENLGLQSTYYTVLGYFWNTSPVDGLRQVLMLVVAWIHGAIGIYTWLRAKDGSARTLRFFYPFVVIVPILALLGYVEAGRQVIPVAEGGLGWVMPNDPNVNGPTVAPEDIPQIIASAKNNAAIMSRTSLALVALALLARWIRLGLLDRSVVRVSYVGGRREEFEVSTGLTLLEMAYENDVPHASICRGRGRCGTCRVRVLQGAKNLTPPDAAEQKVLSHWNAGANERLACQIVPRGGELQVERVVQADYSDLDYSHTRQTAAKGSTA